MAAVPDMNKILVFERDIDDELLCVWVYPKIEKELKSFLSQRCSSLCLDHPNVSFGYSRLQKSWYYIQQTNIKDAGIKPRVTNVFVVIVADNFHPELYEAFTKVVTKSYLQKGTSHTLTKYLSFYTKGFCIKDDSTKFQLKEYDVKKAYLNTCIKELIQLFGMESILIYNALLLKKKIAVYSPKLDTLQHICRTLPAMVFHRLNWNIVYPLMNPHEEELIELKNQRTYVAGFTDVTTETYTDVYDIFLNVPDGEIIINPQAKEYFQMGKMHKEIAKYLVQSAEDEEVGDEDIIRELTRKTKDIITNLKSLDQTNPDDPQITLEMIQERKMTSAMQSFLYNLASAEGLMKL